MSDQRHSIPLTKMNKRLQPFSLRSTGATQVQIAGDFTQWHQNPVNMEKNRNGVWTAALLLELGEHHYRFIVDGVMTLDPRTEAVTSPDDGSQVSRVQVLEAHGCSSACCSQRALSGRQCSKEEH
jgi:1,4-alpha-glucan branching enzyme